MKARSRITESPSLAETVRDAQGSTIFHGNPADESVMRVLVSQAATAERVVSTLGIKNAEVMQVRHWGPPVVIISGIYPGRDNGKQEAVVLKVVSEPAQFGEAAVLAACQSKSERTGQPNPLIRLVASGSNGETGSERHEWMITPRMSEPWVTSESGGFYDSKVLNDRLKPFEHVLPLLAAFHNLGLRSTDIAGNPPKQTYADRLRARFTISKRTRTDFVHVLQKSGNILCDSGFLVRRKPLRTIASSWKCRRRLLTRCALATYSRQTFG